MKRDIHQEITDKIIQAIKAGQAEGGAGCPWHRHTLAGMPQNAVTGHRYQGINVIMLWAAGYDKGFPAHDWDLFRDTRGRTATEAAYGVAFHELTHWTAHKSRLDRDLRGRFGDKSYAAEELIAELGSAFLCGELAITSEPRIDHAKYIKSWLDLLANDKRAIFTAASRATRAVDYLKSLQSETRAAA